MMVFTCIRSRREITAYELVLTALLAIRAVPPRLPFAKLTDPLVMPSRGQDRDVISLMLRQEFPLALSVVHQHWLVAVEARYAAPLTINTYLH